jgi:hypothetical protein
MKKTSFYLSLLLLSAFAVFGTSCSSKLAPLSSSNFNVTPSPLETVGNQIPATINGNFPEKWFNKNAIVNITPVLKYGNGNEVLGEAQSFQGEKILGNRNTISQARGGNFAINFRSPFKPGMEASELYLRFDAKIKNKTVKLPDLKVADGVIATSALASVLTTEPSVADDGFQRIIKQAQDANIMFVIQQAELRSSELGKSDINVWKQRVEQAFKDPKQNVDIEISAYASPDGGAALNERLAEQREKNTSVYLEKELKSRNVNADINARYTAQDWEGFRKLVESSDLQDKELILRVLSMYPDSETREREIKNISFIYQDLAESILPQLRRSRLTANIEIIGKSDTEIMDMWRSNPKGLTVEELLYASSLTDNLADQEKIYQYATVNFPQDYRGWNNIGTMYFKRGELGKAKQAFARAAQVSSSAPEVNMNEALLALLDGDANKAKVQLGQASGANDLGGAMGLLYLLDGSYNQAVDAFGDTKSNNAALAQILAKDYSKAANTLKDIANPDATTAYLAAIIGSRTNNFNEVLSNLQKAISLDRKMTAKAVGDLEFAKYRNNADFVSLLK